MARSLRVISGRPPNCLPVGIRRFRRAYSVSAISWHPSLRLAAPQCLPFCTPDRIVKFGQFEGSRAGQNAAFDCCDLYQGMASDVPSEIHQPQGATAIKSLTMRRNNTMVDEVLPLWSSQFPCSIRTEVSIKALPHSYAGLNCNTRNVF